MFSLGLLIAALVLFVLAGLSVVVHPRVNLLAFGLACWALSALVAGHAP